MKNIYYSLTIAVSLFIIISCSTESTPVYQLTTTTEPAEAGTVTPSSGEYDEGDQVEITATSNEHWVFNRWGGGHTGDENPANVSMNSDKEVVALFLKKEYSLTINTEGEGSVIEKIIPSKTTDYEHGTIIELTAEPDENSKFVEWQGDLNSSNEQEQLTMNGEKSVTAIFEFGFDEDFNDGKPENWTFSDERMKVQSDKLEMDGLSNNTWAFAYHENDFENYQLEFEMSRIESELTKGFTFGVTIHANEELSEEDNIFTEGYLVAFTQNGSVAAFKTVDDTLTNILSWNSIESFNTNLGEFNKFKINVDGSNYDIYVNDVYIISFRDQTFSNGKMGLVTYDTDEGENVIEWNYVKLSSPDPAAKQNFNNASKTVNSSHKIDLRFDQ